MLQVRTGCFCNIGACQRFLGLSADDVCDNLEFGRDCHSGIGDVIEGKHTGMGIIFLKYFYFIYLKLS
jgi:molybdenum cofactor sulfurtransferase